LKSHEMNRIQEKIRLGFSLRCSRPLCSSQSTGGPPQPSPTGNRSKGHKETEQPLPERRSRPGPSGPNSVQAPTPRAKRSDCRSSVLTQTHGLNAMSNVPPMSSGHTHSV